MERLAVMKERGRHTKMKLKNTAWRLFSIATITFTCLMAEADFHIFKSSLFESAGIYIDLIFIRIFYETNQSFTL